MDQRSSYIFNTQQQQQNYNNNSNHTRLIQPPCKMSMHERTHLSLKSFARGIRYTSRTRQNVTARFPLLLAAPRPPPSPPTAAFTTPRLPTPSPPPPPMIPATLFAGPSRVCARTTDRPADEQRCSGNIVNGNSSSSWPDGTARSSSEQPRRSLGLVSSPLWPCPPPPATLAHPASSRPASRSSSWDEKSAAFGEAGRSLWSFRSLL